MEYQSAIHSVKKFNQGYKTMTGTEVGQHSQVGYSVLKADFTPSYKLVYAYIRSFMDQKTQTSTVGFETLHEKTGYSVDTINRALKTLTDMGAITLTKRKRVSQGNWTTYNIYSFPKSEGDMFAMVSFYFLESTLLTTKEKEFILLVFPHLLSNDCIGSIENPMFVPQIAQATGMTRPTVKKRIDQLKAKGLMEEYYSRYSGSNAPELVGYEFNMRAIMLDATDNLRQERNELLEAVLN